MQGSYMSPFGKIVFYVENDQLTSMMFKETEVEDDTSLFITKIKKQLNRYFNHQQQAFDLAIDFKKGTPFQKSIWKKLIEIPYGVTKCYQDIAHEIGHPKAVRAVGQACKNNPIGLVVPCHRVIGKDGSMRGYSGKDYVDLKQKLLAFEKEQPRE